MTGVNMGKCHILHTKGMDTGHIGVYRVYSITWVNMVHRIYRGLQGIQFI